MTDRPGDGDHVGVDRGIEVVRRDVGAILGFREAYRRAMGCQIVHDSLHARGFTDSYLLSVRGRPAGYGSVAGDPDPPREIVKEFYVEPEYRALTMPLFRALLAAARPRWIEAQTNDPFLTFPFLVCATEPVSDRVLFADGHTTRHRVPGLRMRRLMPVERKLVFAHAVEPIGEWALELDGEVVATGGLMFHYNPPWADIYMEVAAAHRRRGYGTYLVQELKRLCYELGCRPGARCNEDNVGSRRTLERAGMVVCGRIVRGAVTG